MIESGSRNNVENGVPGEGWVLEGVLSNETRLGCKHCCLAGCRCSPGCALATKLEKEGKEYTGSSNSRVLRVSGVFLTWPKQGGLIIDF